MLTTIARKLWLAAGGYRGSVPFTVIFANTVAGIRPSTRQAVIAWEIAILITTVGSLVCWHGTHPNRRTTKSGDAGPRASS